MRLRFSPAVSSLPAILPGPVAGVYCIGKGSPHASAIADPKVEGGGTGSRRLVDVEAGDEEVLPPVLDDEDGEDDSKRDEVEDELVWERQFGQKGHYRGGSVARQSKKRSIHEIVMISCSQYGMWRALMSTT